MDTHSHTQEVLQRKYYRRALGGAHVPPTKLFPRLAVNKTILEPRVTRRCSDAGAQYMYVVFSRRNKIPCLQRIRYAEKAIRFRHPDYNPDPAKKLISSSRSRHLWTCNISSKSMYAFLSNNRQTDRQTDRHTQTNAGKRIYLLLCRR